MICSISYVDNLTDKEEIRKISIQPIENFTIVESISSQFLAIINAPINKEASYQSSNFIMEVYLKLLQMKHRNTYYVD